jgi:FixJ family two-component response regulator
MTQEGARCFVSRFRWPSHLQKQLRSSMVPPIIHIVDDDASFRGAIGDLLSACGYRVSLWDSAEPFVAMISDDEAACIILDVQMAGFSGPQVQSRLVAMGLNLPIIFISGYADVPTAVHVMKEGAEDFLTKPVIKAVLLEAIDRALHRYQMARAQNGRLATLRLRYARLTRRERDVFTLLVRGKPHKQIAYQLGTTERTVKLHRHNIMQKIEAQSLAELAVIAEQLGLQPFSPSGAVETGDMVDATEISGTP